MASLESSFVTSSNTATFADPDLYRNSGRSSQAELVVVGRGKFSAEITKIDFKRLWMQRGYETLARVAWIKNSPSRAPISFPTTTNQATMSYSGMEVSPGDIVFHSLGATFHTRTAGETHWGAMSLTPEDLATVGRALVGRELAAPSVTCRMHPAPELMSRLVGLHGIAGQLSKSAPEILAHPEVARSLEQTLLHLLIRCLSDTLPVESSAGTRRHAATLVRLEEQLAANYDRPLYLAEICTAIGVSERTLRICCQEHIGMAPIQYLWLRRMNLARRAFLRATSKSTTVTEVATAYGFWELGRFAVAYRTLFGESPSETLAHPPRDRPRPMSDPFTLVD